MVVVVVILEEQKKSPRDEVMAKEGRKKNKLLVEVGRRMRMRIR